MEEFQVKEVEPHIQNSVRQEAEDDLHDARAMALQTFPPYPASLLRLTGHWEGEASGGRQAGFLSA